MCMCHSCVVDMDRTALKPEVGRAENWERHRREGAAYGCTFPGGLFVSSARGRAVSVGSCQICIAFGGVGAMPMGTALRTATRDAAIRRRTSAVRARAGTAGHRIVAAAVSAVCAVW